MEVRVATEQLFVNPSVGSVWLRDLDSGQGRAVVDGDGPDDASAQLQGGKVTCDGTDLLVIFLVKHGLTEPEKLRVVDLLRAHVGPEPIGFVRQDAAGQAVVEVPDELAEHFAAAVAVMKAAWGWGEALSFGIIVNGGAHSVTTRYDGRFCAADVHPA